MVLLDWIFSVMDFKLSNNQGIVRGGGRVVEHSMAKDPLKFLKL